jgi:predicted transcriptional regulator
MSKRVKLNDSNKDSSQYERARAVEAIRKGMESFERGEGRPAREALEELWKKIRHTKPPMH